MWNNKRKNKQKINISISLGSIVHIQTDELKLQNATLYKQYTVAYNHLNASAIINQMCKIADIQMQILSLFSQISFCTIFNSFVDNSVACVTCDSNGTFISHFLCQIFFPLFIFRKVKLQIKQFLIFCLVRQKYQFFTHFFLLLSNRIAETYRRHNIVNNLVRMLMCK